MSIKIIENFLDDQTIDIINDSIKNHTWAYGASSNPDNPKCIFWIMNVMDDENLKRHILEKIETKMRKRYEIDRIYLNGQTHGQNGSYHQDITGDKNTYFTFLIYMSPEINKNTVDDIGGYTHIKYNDEILAIEPIFSRAIMFDSTLYHKGCAPDSYTILRKSLAVKLKEIK